MNVEDVLEYYWDRKFPVDVVSIAKKMGISIRQKTFADDTVADYNGDILIDTNKPTSMQQFAIAHILGYKVLKLPMKPEVKSAFDPKCVGISRLANTFAADLLVPDSALRYLVCNQQIDDIESLSMELNVCHEIVAYRLGKFKQSF